MNCPQLVESGVYVLGALSPAQRLVYERHLAVCAECRAEVGHLAVLPSLLGRLDEPSVTSVAVADKAPPSVVIGALSRVRRTRRVRRFAAFAGAVAVACVALVAGFALPPSGGSNPPTAITTVAAVMHSMVPVGAVSPVSATVALVPVVGGTEVEMTCTYGAISDAPPGNWSETFVLYVYPRDGGAPQQISTWWAKPGEQISVPGAVTSWPIHELGRIELRTQAGTPLLQYTVL